jgi:hypothetical protein
MRGIKSPIRQRGAGRRPGMAIAFALAKNMLHGGHSTRGGIMEPQRAIYGLALPAITP